MIASVAAEASLSQHYAPVSTSGLEWSDTQRAALAAIHPYPPVLAFDGDHSGLSANIARGRDFLADGTETVMTIWPNEQDPVDYLREHGPSGLAAVTRKGCLSCTPAALRPIHIGRVVAREVAATGPNETVLPEATDHPLKLSWSGSVRLGDGDAALCATVQETDYLGVTLGDLAGYAANLKPAARRRYSEALGAGLADVGAALGGHLRRNLEEGLGLHTTDRSRELGREAARLVISP
jgi:hypothetical protein